MWKKVIWNFMTQNNFKVITLSVWSFLSLFCIYWEVKGTWFKVCPTSALVPLIHLLLFSSWVQFFTLKLKLIPLYHTQSSSASFTLSRIYPHWKLTYQKFYNTSSERCSFVLLSLTLIVNCFQLQLMSNYV